MTYSCKTIFELYLRNKGAQHEVDGIVEKSFASYFRSG